MAAMASGSSPSSYGTTSHFGHRTNSLAFSKSDCHTCAALRRKCDRRRPYCGTCQSSRNKCAGFALDLVWKDDDGGTESSPPPSPAPSPLPLQYGKTTPETRSCRRTTQEKSSISSSTSKNNTATTNNFRFVRGKVHANKPRKSRRNRLGGAAAAGLISKFRLDDQHEDEECTSPQQDNDVAIQSNPGEDALPTPAPDEITADREPLHLDEVTIGNLNMDFALPPIFSLSPWPFYAAAQQSPGRDPRTPETGATLDERPRNAAQDLLSPNSSQTQEQRDPDADASPPTTGSDPGWSSLGDDDNPATLQDATGNGELSITGAVSGSVTDDNSFLSATTVALEWDLPPTVQFQNLAQKYSSMLARFNEEFCVVPLSIDCRSNPFRARRDFAESFPFLLHSVMAITCHHLGRKHENDELRRESFDHWSTAVQAFGTSLSSAGLLPLLDTMLMLINFESTQSVYAALDVHLAGANTLFQQTGALERFHRSPRLRAQLAMLVWWDVTSSLTARRKPRLASVFIDLLQAYDESDGWSFITLNGCPTLFVAAMSRLAELAERYTASEDPEESFDHAELNTILLAVKTFSYNDAAATDVMDLDDDHNEEDAEDAEEDPDSMRDRHHCVEAWRHAILLYALRVFHQHSNSQHPPQERQSSLRRLRQIKHHARVILDSTRCVPPQKMFQKQILLPVFLAGAEVGDTFNREFVRQYCDHWRGASRFDQFRGAKELLEVIWEEWSPWTRDTYWWGVKVERGMEGGSGDENGHDGGGGQGLSKQLLLG